jgi:hypothetical protein
MGLPRFCMLCFLLDKKDKTLYAIFIVLYEISVKTTEEVNDGRETQIKSRG